MVLHERRSVRGLPGGYEVPSGQPLQGEKRGFRRSVDHSYSHYRGTLGKKTRLLKAMTSGLLLGIAVLCCSDQEKCGAAAVVFEFGMFCQHFGGDRRFGKMLNAEAGVDQCVDECGHRSMIFDDIVGQPLCVPYAFQLVVVYGPMAAFSLGSNTPLLGGSGGEYGVLDGEDKCASFGETAMNHGANQIEALDVVECQGTEHDVEGGLGEIDVLNGGQDVFDPWIVRRSPGAGQHILRDVHADHGPRARLPRVAAVPSKAAAEVEDALVLQIGDHGAENGPLAGTLKTADRPRHSAVFSEELRIVVLVLLHYKPYWLYTMLYGISHCGELLKDRVPAGRQASGRGRYLDFRAVFTASSRPSPRRSIAQTFPSRPTR